jgi:hypothetical protein
VKRAASSTTRPGSTGPSNGQPKQTEIVTVAGTSLVQHEPRILDAVASSDGGDDLLRSRHLRYAVVADEAHRLDPPQARACEPVDELGAHAGNERLRLVLQAVARADVAERDARHASGGTPATCRRVGAPAM